MKKIFSLGLTIMMLVCLSAGICGGSVYAADAGYVENFESYGEDVLPTDFRTFSAYATGDAKIQSDSTPGIGKYLSMATNDGATNMGMGISNTLDLAAADSVIAYEFDFKATYNANLTIARLYSDDYGANLLGLLTTNTAGNIVIGTTATSTPLALNKWNHFKVIFYTKTSECELFYNDNFLVKTTYTTPVNPYVPKKIFLNLTGVNGTSAEYGLDNIKMYETTAPSKDEYGYKDNFENHTMSAAPNGLTAFSAYATGDAEIKNDTTSGIGQYMSLKTNDGSTNMGLDITTTLDLAAADKVIAYEFDFKATSSSTTTISCFLDSNNQRATLILAENGQIQYYKNNSLVYSGAFITPNVWNHFKVILYTASKEYDVFYNDTFFAKGTYTLTTASYVPKKLFFATTAEIGIDNIKLYETTAPSKEEYGFEDNFEGASYTVGNAPSGLYKNSTTNESDALIQQDATTGIGKYLELKRDNWSGSAEGFKIATPINTTLDLYAEDSVIALEFDCMGTGNLTEKNITFATNGYTYQMPSLYLGESGYIQAWDSDADTFISTGIQFATNTWNHFKVVFYTKAREYAIYYNNGVIPIAKKAYNYDTFSLSSFVPSSVYISMYSFTAAENGQPFSESFGIDNVKVYEMDKPSVYYGSAKIYKDYDYDNGCDDGDLTETGLQSGNITAEVSVINQNAEPVSVTLIAALYNGDVLDKISIEHREVGTYTGVAEKIATEALAVPENLSGYKLRTYVWDSMSSLKPLEPFTEFIPAS